MTNARDRRWPPESSEASEASESAEADADGSSSERTDSDADGSSSSPLLLCGGEAAVSEIQIGRACGSGLTEAGQGKHTNLRLLIWA